MWELGAVDRTWLDEWMRDERLGIRALVRATRVMFIRVTHNAKGIKR